MVPSESIRVFHNLQPDLLITPDPHQVAQRPAVMLPLQVITLWTSLTGNSPSGWLRSGLWDTDYLLAKPSHPVTFSLCFTDFQPASSLPNLPEMASGSSLKSLQGEGLCAHCRAWTPLHSALWAPKGWRLTGQPSESEEGSALRSRGCGAVLTGAVTLGFLLGRAWQPGG